MLIAVAGAKGAVGVTTVAYALARQLTGGGDPSLFVEADPDGGAVAARLGLSEEPGLASMAAGIHHEAACADSGRHVQQGRGGPPMVLLPSAPGYATAVLRTLSEWLSGLGGPAQQEGHGVAALHHVVADVGRLRGESAALPLLLGAERLVVVVRPTLEGADAVAVRLAELGELRNRVGLVTMGDGPYGGDELARLLSVRHLGRLPHERSAIGSAWAARGGRSSRPGPFLRAMAPIAEVLRAADWPAVGEPAGKVQGPSPSPATPAMEATSR